MSIQPAQLPDYCTFKTDLIRERAPYLCGKVLEVLFSMAEWCQAHAVPLELTDAVSTASEDHALRRVSDEHATGRAFDVSLHGWSEQTIGNFINYFTQEFGSLGAVGKSTGVPRLIVRHNIGLGDHIHVQVARQYGVQDPLKGQAT